MIKMLRQYNNIVILIYHNIVPDNYAVQAFSPGDRPYLFTLSEFYRHLNYLSTNKFSVLSVDGLCTINEKKPHCKAVAITFDDGHESDYSIAFPALVKRGMRATFYVVAYYIGKKDFVSWGQLKEMQSNGMEIGSHSYSHRCLLDLNDRELKEELNKSREVLEDRLGCPIRSFSIPFGFKNERIIRLAFKAGYQTICTSDIRLYPIKSVPCVYGRISIKRNDNFDKFCGIVEKRWLTIAKLSAEERIKSGLKNTLGRKLWLKVRERILGYEVVL